jgi:fructokinase
MKNGVGIVCFGETLWDVLPDKKIAGGAPMNVAIRLASLGLPVKLISRLGNDEEGSLLKDIIEKNRVDTSLVQKDSHHPSGKVLVSLNEAGNASYDIVYPSAWDFIELSAENSNAVATTGVFVFGSLASRSETSRETLLELCKEASYKVFDVNLRKPFIDLELIQQLMKLSQFIKLNDDELVFLAGQLNKKEIGTTEKEMINAATWLQDFTGANTICVTRGAKGALLLQDSNIYAHEGFTVTVQDTIGAGDSFLATLVYKLSSGTHPADALEIACAVGAIVASKEGANPIISTEDINALIKRDGR